MDRSFWKGVAAFYLLMAPIYGAAMCHVVPAMNLAGAIYYSATWPTWPVSVVLDHDIVPIPQWAFTNKEPTP